MIRVRRVIVVLLPVNHRSFQELLSIWREQFPDVDEQEVAAVHERLRNPMPQRFRRILFVAENASQNVRGFALVVYAPEEKFCFLEYIAAAPGRTGGGLGAALYQRLREEMGQFGVVGLFFECSPDDEAACPDPGTRRTNAARLKFYEGFGARPLIGNEYDAPIKPGDTGMPILVYDDLGTGRPLRRNEARTIVRAILERKYGELCPPDYVERVIQSFRTATVALRPPRYFRQELRKPAAVDRRSPESAIGLVVNDRHDIHHVRDRGYVESPVRIDAILRELSETDLFVPLAVRKYPERHIKAVHDRKFVDYLARVCASIPEGKSVYPYVFPLRNHARAPKELAIRSGYYCIDTFTPLNRNAHLAATRAVDCALTAAESLLGGRLAAYALVRPPGHHAERRAFGGFCYFNSAAIAAHYLSSVGRVAILDIDYHHGNGQQDIFYHRNDVLTISIHGHPKFAYPYFSGFEDEHGEGPGEGFNVNVPLPESVDGKRHRKELERQLRRIADFAPQFLVVALGLDPAKGDPTGTWSLLAADFRENGRLIGGMGRPLLVLQEGGYRTRTLGVNARAFFEGLDAGMRHA